MAVVSLAGALGCASVSGARRREVPPTPALAAWGALVEGRPDEAARGFDARLAAAPGDVLARFGRATLAFERGAPEAALDDYAAVIVGAAGAGARGDDAAWGALVAPVAAARLLTLDDEVAPRRRAAVEATVLALPNDGRLSWRARLELARLAERVARRAGDVAALERTARARGCAREVRDAGRLGPLPHLDLDDAAPLAAPEATVVAAGCRLTVSTHDGRPGAERLRAAFEAPAGAYDVLLDYDGEARLALDGGAPVRHGSELRYGPRVSRFSVDVPAGRHELELRLALPSGRAELGLMLLPRAAGEAPRFVAPSEQVSPASRGARAAPVETAWAPSDAAAAALGDYCRAFAADGAGEVDHALELAGRLEARRRFAPGLTLAASIARDDPTRPPSFSRDAARGDLRAALAADARDARAWQTLAGIELEDDRAREAIDDARAATRAAPAWWAPEIVLSHALAARGLDWDADRALDRAAGESQPSAARAAGPSTPAALADTPCLVVEALLRRADDRRELDAEIRLEDALAACDAESEARLDRLRARGELPAAATALRRAMTLAPDRDDLPGELAQVLWAEGRRAEAAAVLADLVARAPADPMWRVRLADAQAALGQGAAARETVREALSRRPDAAETRRAARALGVALPLDAYRVDGRAAIRAFEASGRHYAAPAVVVLDRSVERVFGDGARMTLTHEIVRVQSKDAIDRWAEVEVPAGAEVLTLRTHKPDGTTREPEEIAGKDTVSAANVAIGDYIEWEMLEAKEPSGAFAPGFLGDRFYFQSFDAPLDRSEYVLVTPRAMKVEVDRRAGAPVPAETTAADGARVTTFVAASVPQLFAERAAAPAIEYVPSVRASSALAFSGWTRYVEEQTWGAARSSPALRARAQELVAAARAGAAGAPPDPTWRARLAAAVVKWVTETIEAVDDLRDPATLTLARGRGNRLALVLALLREVGVPARAVLARSRLVAETAAPAPLEELDDFSDAIVEIDAGAPRAAPVWVDPRLRYAAFGYLPPSLDGARTLALGDAHFDVARSTATADHRTVDVTIRLDEQGGGVAVATEELTGWPALEWAELVERFGADHARLRQDFEQRWLGLQFPGARLRDLAVDLPKNEPGAAAGAVRVRYSFVSPQLAVKGDHEMKLSPTFFRSQPGRRFATEPQRATTLVLGFDVPVHLTATVELPRAARLVGPTSTAGAGAGPAATETVERKGAYRFVEERRLLAGAADSDVLVLTRDSVLPLMRVAPGEYAGVAADLRRVDGLEQQEIRFRLRPARGTK
jgi:cellulose synthase operon protein C